MNDQGRCWAGKPNCTLHNPTTGDCVVCKEKGVYPYNGYCCPKGQIHYHGQCILVQQAQYLMQAATGPTCRTRHPLLGHCLRCVDGWVPDAIMPERCVRKY